MSLQLKSQGKNTFKCNQTNSTELVQEVTALQTATSANPVSGGGDVEGSKQWLFIWFNINDDERGFEQLSTAETTKRLRGTENRSLNLLN